MPTTKPLSAEELWNLRIADRINARCSTTRALARRLRDMPVREDFMEFAEDYADYICTFEKKNAA